MTQKATVIKVKDKNKAIVRISKTGIEKEVTALRPVVEKERVEVYQNIII